MRSVKCVWKDITSHSGWMDIEHLPHATTLEVTTVGFLLELNKDNVKISQSYQDKGIVGEVIVIPRRNIVCLEELKKDTWKKIRLTKK